MSFGEFLLALGKDELVSLLSSGDAQGIGIFHQELIEYVRIYLYVGGMPEAVGEYSQSADFGTVREIHDEILRSYERDFAKHAPATLTERLRLLWHNIPAQLARENKKFIFSAVREGGRGRNFEEGLQWLKDSSLIGMVKWVKRPRLPLGSYSEHNAFKLFMVDVGLLSTMSRLSARTLLEGARVFTEYKGALVEQFVFQELLAAGYNPYYWADEKAQYEVDFLIEANDVIIPIEVKSGTILRSASLKAYIKREDPIRAIRFSENPASVDGVILNAPLYMSAHISL
jgi:predicted AAA+ superfamily ATPase